MYSFAQRHDTPLAVVSAIVHALQSRVTKDLRGELKIESAFAQVFAALASVPTEAHSRLIYVCIYE